MQEGDNTAFVSIVPLCPWSPSIAWLRSIHRPWSGGGWGRGGGEEGEGLPVHVECVKVRRAGFMAFKG